jgi:CheY-like chemotaxis protein
MTSTQTFIAVLVALIGTFILIFVLLHRRPGSAEFSVGDLFKAKVSLDSDDKTKAVEAIGNAAEEKGKSSAMATIQARSDVSSLNKVPISRVLWVDDHPDNNVNETLALLHLGVFVVTATSNRAARRYLDDIEFNAVITDLGRPPRGDDGAALVKELHADKPKLPVIVYTGNAPAVRLELTRDGAAAVEDEPAALLNAILREVR